MSESENNWQPAKVEQDACEWAVIPGTSPTVRLQLQKGWPFQVMRAFAADFNAYVEHLRDDDSASWTPTNKASTSNHLNATAMDLNWNSHEFHAVGTFNGDQMRTIRELLAFYEDTIFWAGDWHNPVDEMHWQMGYSTWNNPHTGDFISRKIRSDGLSTFRRGDTPQWGPAAEVLARAVGLKIERANEILVMVMNGLRRSECTNVNRIAMWLAQMGHESVNFFYTEEIQSGDENTDRWKYKGRTWIQITWSYNYADFGKWCADRNLVAYPMYFVDHPRELAELKWAGLGPAWYWTVQRPDINQLSDARDIELVSRRINGTNPNTGRANGIQDRIDRYNRALALGDQLLALISDTQEDDMFNDEDRRLLKILAEDQFSTRSMYGDPDDEDTVAGRVMNAHAFGWDQRVESSALRGEQWAIKLVVKAAAGTDQFLSDHARAVLNEVEAASPEGLEQFIKSQGG